MFRPLLVSLCSSRCFVMQNNSTVYITVWTTLCLSLPLALLQCVDVAICLLVPFWSLRLLRLVSNLVSHRDWNKLGAIWGIFTAYLNYENERAFFSSLHHLANIWEAAAAPVASLSLFLSLSLSLSIPHTQTHHLLTQVMSPNPHNPCPLLLTDSVNML